LTEMRDKGLDYKEVLQSAQELGYAEADPTLDVNGWDQAHKAIILASMAAGGWVDPARVQVEGVEKVRRVDIDFVEKLGYTIKLLAVIKLGEEREVEVRVQPSLISKQHLLAAVNDVYNAVLVRGHVSGDTLYYGSGAGQDPTTSAVLADVVSGARLLGQTPDNRQPFPHEAARVLPINETRSNYYLRVKVANENGVLAQVAAVIGQNDAGVTSVYQPLADQDSADLVFIIGDATFGQLKRAIAGISALSCTRGEPTLLRMEILD
ncbi:MAG: homoserine dehydrogenase, partial [Verrucomicrobiota bacterium]